MGDLVDSLKQRDKKTPAAGITSSLDKRAFLNDNKRRLTEYAETINRLHGKCGLTIHQAIWLHQKMRKDFSFKASLLDPIPLPGAEELSFEQAERLKQSAEIYGQHLSQVLNGKSLKQHPWHGVANWQISTAAEREIVLALQAIANISNQIQKQIDDLNKACGRELLTGEASLRGLIQSKDALPVIPLGLMADLIPKLGDRNAREKLVSLIEVLERYRQIRDNVQQSFSKRPDVNSAEVTVLQTYCLEVRQMEIDWRSTEELHDYISQIEGLAADLSRISSWFHNICLYLNCALPFSVQNASLMVKTADIFDEIPWQAIHLRAPELENDGLVPVASQAYSEAEKLHQRERSISERMDLTIRPSREQLVQYVEAFTDAGLLSFTKRDFILARRAWRGMNTRNRKISYQEMAQDFRELIHLGDKQNEFVSNPLYQKVLGNLFNGLQTPLARLLALSAWYLAVKRKLGVSSNSKPGAQMLKEYLVHARKVRSDSYDRRKRLAQTDFQDVLCNALNKKGYETVPQVGVESYWIDVAVAHPDEKDHYILGIESDGALYHSSRSARDRDRLRQNVLKELGWNLHRIWSAEWFRNRDREITRIIQRIEQLRQREKCIESQCSPAY